MMLGENIVATTGQTELRHAYVHCHSTFGMILRKTRVSDLIDLQIPELLVGSVLHVTGQDSSF